MPNSNSSQNHLRPYLATLHKSKEIKVFRLRRSKVEYQYITKFQLEAIPVSFVVFNDVYVVSYKTHAEYVRLENKGKESETLTRLMLWTNSEEDEMLPQVIYDESIQSFIVTQGEHSFYLSLRGVYDREFNKIKW